MSWDSASFQNLTCSSTALLRLPAKRPLWRRSGERTPGCLYHSPGEGERQPRLGRRAQTQLSKWRMGPMERAANVICCLETAGRERARDAATSLFDLRYGNIAHVTL